MRLLNAILILCLFVAIVSAQYGFYGGYGGFGHRYGYGFRGNPGIGNIQSGATIGNLYGIGSRGYGRSFGYFG